MGSCVTGRRVPEVLTVQKSIEPPRKTKTDLAELLNLKTSTLSEEERTTLIALLDEFQDVYSRGANDLGKTSKVSRFSPALRWGLPFVPRSRSSRPLLCPSASHQTPPLSKETRRAMPSASVAVARSHPSASGWSSLIVPAVRIYSSHALGHRAAPHSWPRIRLETTFPYLATVQAFGANSTPGRRLCIRPNSAPEASQSINARKSDRLNSSAPCDSE